MATDLKWGETPFDHMTPDDVLLNAKRMYSALVMLQSVARQNALAGGAYWGIGVGGAAIEKGRQALGAIDGEYEEREPAHRTFYRYADDLLFDTSKHPMIGSGWSVCDQDGTMLRATVAGDRADACIRCRGPMRPLVWTDLAPTTPARQERRGGRGMRR